MVKKSPLDDVWISVEPRRPGAFHLLAVAVSLGLFGWFYFFIAGVLIETTNQNLHASDQAHNIKRALLSKQYEGLDLAAGQLKGFSYWWPHDTDGVVAPLWSRVAGVLTDDTHTPSAPGTESEMDRKLFERGKWFNVRASFVFLCVITLGAAWAFPGGTIGVINLMLLSGLGALLPRAVYFQPEPLYYAFFAGTWICCLMAMLGNRVVPYIGAGLFAGLAYLTKTSIQPLLIAFIAVMGLRLASGIFGVGRSETCPLHWWKCAGGMLLMFGLFLALVWPRLQFSRREFGDRFHTYPSYWMWMDKFEDCYTWMADHPDKYSLSQIASDDLPSPGNYWKNHTGTEIAERATTGWLATVNKSLFPRSVSQWGWEAKKPWKHLLPDRGWMLAALLGIVCIAVAAAKLRGEKYDAPAQRVVVRAAGGDRVFAVLFVLLLCGGYSFAYGWYERIGGGERFLLSLYVPLAFSLVWAGQSMVDHLPGDSKWRRVYTAGQLVLFAFLLFRITNLYMHPEFLEAAKA